MSRMTDNALKRSKTYAERIVKMDLKDLHSGKLYRDCIVLSEVYAVCREHREGMNDLIIEFSGDDGSWWRSSSYDEAWVEGRIACLRRV